MPNVPPDPRAVINARIHHFKKKTQKLNLECLEAEADLERAKQAVRQSKALAATPPAPAVATAVPSIPPMPAEAPAESAACTSAVVVVRPFADGVGFALITEASSLWFDNEIHAINYAQDVFPHCNILVLQNDGTARHQYSATAPGE